MRRLVGKGCVVTGATGMAAAAARRFTEEGARVFVVAHERAAGGLPHVLADLRDEGAAERAFQAALVELGRIDAVFAVAGGSGRGIGDGPVHELTLAAWDGTFALNATPAFLTAREAVRAMLAREPDVGGSRGSIVLMSSVLAFDPAPSLFATHAYAAAKAAIVGLTRSMAAYYADRRVRVNAIAPALVATPMAARAAADPASVAFAAHAQPLAGGFLDPTDVVEAAVYLCADESRTVTGQVLTIDGGWTARGVER